MNQCDWREIPFRDGSGRPGPPCACGSSACLQGSLRSLRDDRLDAHHQRSDTFPIE